MIYKTQVAICALMMSGSALHAQQACEDYTVRAGDSLSGIARTAYGSVAFQQIWDANRAIIGSNPNRISPGMSLALPCADGTIRSDRTAAAEAPIQASAPADPEPAVPSTNERMDIRLVTATGYAPFTDEDMAGGGIYTQLVRAAVGTVEEKAETSISFVNDWGSHLDALLPSQAFDGAFPWLRPNCEAPDELTENSAFRCEEFLHSDPFYEIVNSLTVAADSPLAVTDSYEDFHGTTICLPDGYSDVSLNAGGLTEPVVTLTRPTDPDDCIQLLDAGEVDVVSLEQRQVQDIIMRLGHDGKFASNPNLNNVNTLAVFVSKENPDAPEVIEVLNEGLANIRESGVWFETVRVGFREYYEQ